ncbi:nucleotidyltransferase family protein [Halobacterium litoreum]|uniref:NTP transferase domain-containing protein n=1 Tax=Halobacterium litoreum TaxID=2039234 RepID=A0ABD5NBZ9_9EURY|nr:nucleotidyltransferase family protein [Halobacterium litoreum]UHH14318.1 nucleotidyltransferase family protein [Halobacterium litoreum]
MTLPAVDPPGERTGDTRVAGVLLAAGTSSRYGDANKLLADVDGAPMVRRSAETLLAAGLAEVVVVVGYEADRVRDALDGLDVRFVENPDYETGQASSVRAGVCALADADAAVFALGDMPYVDSESVRALVAAYEDGAGSALAAGFASERGNPVLFGARHFDALADSDGDTGGKQILLGAEDGAVVETGDAGVRRDVDRPDDVA